METQPTVVAELLCHPNPPKPTWARTSQIMESLRKGRTLKQCAKDAGISVDDVIYIWAWRYDRYPELRKHLRFKRGEIRQHLMNKTEK